MGIYCDIDDMIERYGESEITQASDNDGNGLASPDVNVVNVAIYDAENLIDQYLARRYKMPLACVPKSIKLMACAIARYFLHDNNASERIKLDYEREIAKLEMIKNKAVDLYDQDCGYVFEELPTNSINVVAPTKVYDSDRLKSFNFMS